MPATTKASNGSHLKDALMLNSKTIKRIVKPRSLAWKTITLIVAILLAGGLTSSRAQGTWTQKTDFGGTSRFGAVGFSIGTKGYIGGGADTNGPTNDFWEYDPATNAWTQKASFGVVGCYNAVGFSIGTKGYIGTGEGGSITTDFWEYNPSTNSWTQKANFGGTARSAAVGFSIDSKGYIGTGSDGSVRNDFWEYDPATNGWTQKANFGGTARYLAVGFSIGSKGYIGTGNDGNYKNDFWEYDPSTNAWTQKANFGGIPRFVAVGFSVGSKGYIGDGINSGYINDFWEYDPSTNGWTQKANFGGTARQLATGFSIGSKGYMGTGYDITSNHKKDFWEYTPECTVPTISISSNGNTTVCKPATVSLTATTTGTAGTYQWKKGNNNIAGATNATYDATKTATYKCVVTNACGTATSNSIAVTVNAQPAATITHGSLDLCGQSSVLLTANAGGGLTYQWKKGANDISGATNQTYSATAKGTYKVVVTNSFGCSKTSAGAKVVKTCKESSFTSVETAVMSLYPNPAEDQATIQFTLSQASHVSIKVYDLGGKEIATLVDGDAEQGEHSVLLNTNQFSKGVYMVRMVGDFGIANQKLIVE